jgi:hypothetical protein
VSPQGTTSFGSQEDESLYEDVEQPFTSTFYNMFSYNTSPTTSCVGFTIACGDLQEPRGRVIKDGTVFQLKGSIPSIRSNLDSRYEADFDVLDGEGVKATTKAALKVYRDKTMVLQARKDAEARFIEDLKGEKQDNWNEVVWRVELPQACEPLLKTFHVSNGIIKVDLNVKVESLYIGEQTASSSPSKE